MIVGAVAVIQGERAIATVPEIIRVAVLKGEVNAARIRTRFANVRGPARAVAFDPGNVVAVLSAVTDRGEGGGGVGGQDGESGDGELHVEWFL